MEKAVSVRASEVTLERVSEGLEVTLMFGNTGIGSVVADRNDENEMVGYICDAAKLDERDRGKFELQLCGAMHTIRVERYDLFGESAFRLKVRKSKNAP
jgi:hypothetical protein